MNLRNVLILLTALLSFATVASSADPTARPNILILLGDDIDRDSLGPWGGQARTPHLDQLAKDGVRLNKVYANVAMCAPFRQELLSGRTAWRTRAMPNHSRSVAGTKSLPHYLRPLGYRVGLLGKSHVGPRDAYPFDNVGSLPKKEDANDKAVTQARGYVVKAREAGEPFCLVVASHDAHGPYTHGEKYDPATLKLPKDAIDTPVYRNELAKHLSEVSNFDALLGSLRAMLAEEKLSENTVVVFCSEQGNAFPFSKWTCFNDGLASGVVVAQPGVIPPGTASDHITWIADLAPTLLEAAGGKVTPKDFDGKSQWANLTGGDKSVHRHAYGTFCNCNIIDNRERVFPIRSIRDERYSLIWSPRAKEEITSNVTLTKALAWIEADGKGAGSPDSAASWVAAARSSSSAEASMIVERLHHRPEWALYDRETDPEELKNLADDPAAKAVRERLQTELESWLKRWDDADPVATERAFVKKK